MGREVWEREVRGGWREVRGGWYSRGATLTLLIRYLCIAKVKVDSRCMANMEHTIRLRRESSNHLDWTNRLTAL